jgi:hypothetical protein
MNPECLSIFLGHQVSRCGNLGLVSGDQERLAYFKDLENPRQFVLPPIIH